jgi:hypothetical protein
MAATEPTRRHCERCGVPVDPGRGDFYLVGIVAVADPSPPAFTEEDLVRDVGKEIDRLLGRLKDVDEQGAMDQVYRRKVIALCAPCYSEWIEDPVGPPPSL